MVVDQYPVLVRGWVRVIGEKVVKSCRKDFCRSSGEKASGMQVYKFQTVMVVVVMRVQTLCWCVATLKGVHSSNRYQQRRGQTKMEAERSTW